jgi:hypothetical protein
LNIIDANATRSEIDRSTANQPGQCGFGHAVDTRSREGCANGRVASDKDDSASVIHSLPSSLNAYKSGPDVDGNHAIKILQAIAVNCASNENAGVVYKDVECAESIDRLDNGSLELSPSEALSALRASALPPEDSISFTS